MTDTVEDKILKDAQSGWVEPDETHVQPDLLAEFAQSGDTNTADLKTGASAEKVVLVPEKRKAGRPKGSNNKATDDLKSKLLDIGMMSPLEFLVRTYNTPLDRLRTKLVCNKLEAENIRIKAARDALPYFSKKQPVEIEMNGTQMMIVERGYLAEENEPDDRKPITINMDGGDIGKASND